MSLPPRPPSQAWTTFVSVLIAGLVVALLLALWQTREAILLAFAAAVFAVVLLAIARPIERWTGLSRRASLPLAAVGLAGTVAGVGFLIGNELQSQFGSLQEALPGALETLQRRLGIDIERFDAGGRSGGPEPAGGGQLRSLPDLLGAARTAMGNLVSIGALVFNTIASLLVVLVGGVFLALEPERYRRGLVLLLPPDRQTQADTALGDCGHALHLWLQAQVLSMILVGTLSGLGAWAIGLTSPLAIGVFAGLTEFVPIVGPWIGALPALMLAITIGPEMVAWTATLFLLVQQLESNIISPLVQQRMADIPPVLVLFGVIALGLLFGVAGVLVAAPLTLVAYVLITRLYIRDTLGQDVPVPGTKDGD